MGEFASKGVAGAGLGLGIAGTALGLMNNGWFGNGNGLFGNGCNGRVGCNYGYGIYGDIGVSEALAERDAELAFYRAKDYSDKSDVEIYKYIDGQLRDIAERMHQNELKQCEFNCTTTASIGVLSSQLKDAQALLASITKTAVPESVICSFSGRGCGTNNL